MNEMINVARNGIWVRMIVKTKAGSSGNRRTQPCLFIQRSLKLGFGSFFLAALASALVSRGVAVVVAICATPPYQVWDEVSRPFARFTPELSCQKIGLSLRQAQPPSCN